MRRGAFALRTLGFILIGLLGAAAWAQEAGGQADSKTNSGGTAANKPAGDGADAKTRRPSPEAVMKAFQDQRPTNAPVRSTSTQTPTPTPPGEASAYSGGRGLMREGQYINGVAGRLERDGPWWTIVFESDSPGTPQPPMRLLPNQKLENMTRAQEASTEGIVFEVSGELTLFGSRNYLLVRKSLRRRSVANLRK